MLFAKNIVLARIARKRLFFLRRHLFLAYSWVTGKTLCLWQTKTENNLKFEIWD